MSWSREETHYFKRNDARGFNALLNRVLKTTDPTNIAR